MAIGFNLVWCHRVQFFHLRKADEEPGSLVEVAFLYQGHEVRVRAERIVT
jgi:hypothetical protein